MSNAHNILLKTALSSGLLLTVVPFAKSTGIPEKGALPNFIVIFTDDMGYGDIGVYGHPNHHTPRLDRMAEEGKKFTDFYVAAPVSTPSRAALLTGRFPVRSGMASKKRRVLFPNSNGGLPPSELTIAKALKSKGYQTAAIGKWHLGHTSPHLPADHGFDSYFGIPYSNDMDKVEKTNYFTLADMERYEAYNVPLTRDEQVVERPADQRTITRRYTEEAVAKIRNSKGGPFFIYLAHSMPMEMATTMDILPTFMKLAGIELPDDRVYDGYDMAPVLFGTEPNPRDAVLYYRDTEVFAVRKGDFKAHFITQPEYGTKETTVHDTPLLYNLREDPSEKFDVSADHPDVILEMERILERHLSTVTPVENQLEK